MLLNGGWRKNQAAYKRNAMTFKMFGQQSHDQLSYVSYKGFIEKSSSIQAECCGLWNVRPARSSNICFLSRLVKKSSGIRAKWCGLQDVQTIVTQLSDRCYLLRVDSKSSSLQVKCDDLQDIQRTSTRSSNRYCLSGVDENIKRPINKKVWPSRVHVVGITLPDGTYKNKDR